MALVKTTVNAQIGTAVYEDAAATSTKVTLTASSGSSIHQILITNTANTHKVYLRLYTSDPTVGTTDPACIFPCEASASSEYSFSAPLVLAAVYYAVCQEAGTAGSTTPANAITVKFVTSGI